MSDRNRIAFRSLRTFFLRSAMSTLPCASVGTVTIFMPAITADAGLVPCALTGMMHTGGRRTGVGEGLRKAKCGRLRVRRACVHARMRLRAARARTSE